MKYEYAFTSSFTPNRTEMCTRTYELHIIIYIITNTVAFKGRPLLARPTINS